MSKKVKSQMGMLPNYEQNMYSGLKGKSTVDELKENSMIKRSLLRCLGSNVSMKLETGEVVDVTIADIVVARTLQDAIENPTPAKLKDLAAITGELKEKAEVALTPLQELLGDIVISNGK